MNLAYVLPRLVRHFLPERVVRFLLLRSVLIKPGLETVDPQAAIQRYAAVLTGRQRSLRGSRVLVFGYGGRFDIGVGLLEGGASYVALCDRYARPDEPHNRALLSSYPRWLRSETAGTRPESEHMQLIESDIKALTAPEGHDRFDIVVSNSVYEHVDDPEGITTALAAWTKPDGLHIHFVDLRDHYFTYPFEMLRFSERTWARFLNPSSNHNRLRLRDYRRVFEPLFADVNIEVLATDQEAFRQARPYLRQEFLSGDADEDAVTLIRITAGQPRR